MKLLTTILILFIGQKLFATAQIPDVFIYNGDTSIIHNEPLEPYLKNKHSRSIGDINFASTGMCTALWKGYVATWKVENDSLFLVRIQINYCGNTPLDIDLKTEFGSDKVFANWLSGTLTNLSGKQIKYIHAGYESIYEYERLIAFSEGRLISLKTYDNSKSRTSIYSTDAQIMHKFLYDNINWELVEAQALTEHKLVIANFNVDENGKPKDIKILKSINPILDKEAERVVRLLPEWDVYFRHGEVTDNRWALPIRFDKETYKRSLKLD